MLFSKIQLGQADDQDPMMHEIKKLLSFLTYEEWQEHVVTKGFDIACMGYHSKVHSDSRPYCRFESLSTSGRILDKMRYPECIRNMEKYITFP